MNDMQNLRDLNRKLFGISIDEVLEELEATRNLLKSVKQKLSCCESSIELRDKIKLTLIDMAQLLEDIN